MIRALYTAASGMNAQQANIDNVAHNLANGIDPNRLWSPTGVDQTTTGVAYQPEQQAVRQAILAWRPRLILDTHEYGATANSTTGTYRFDPGTTSATGTPTAVVNASIAVLNAMKVSNGRDVTIAFDYFADADDPRVQKDLAEHRTHDEPYGDADDIPGNAPAR